MKYSQAVLIACVSGATLASASTPQPSGAKPPSKKAPSGLPSAVQLPGEPTDKDLLLRAFDDDFFVRALNEKLVERGVISGDLIQERDVDKHMALDARDLEKQLLSKLPRPISTPLRTLRYKPAARPHRQFPVAVAGAASSRAKPVPNDDEPERPFGGLSRARPLSGNKRDFGLYDELETRDDKPSGRQDRPFGGISRAKPLPKDYRPGRPFGGISRARPLSGHKRGLGLHDGLDARDFIGERDFDEDMYARELEEELIARAKLSRPRPAPSPTKPVFNDDEPVRPSRARHSSSSSRRDLGLYDDLDTRDLDEGMSARELEEELAARSKTSQPAPKLEPAPKAVPGRGGARPYPVPGITPRPRPFLEGFDPTKIVLGGRRKKYVPGVLQRRDFGLYDDLDRRDFVEERDLDEGMYARELEEDLVARSKPSAPAKPRVRFAIGQQAGSGSGSSSIPRPPTPYYEDHRQSGGRSGTNPPSGHKRDLDTRDFDLNQLD